jgi:hypothetical protein
MTIADKATMISISENPPATIEGEPYRGASAAKYFRPHVKTQGANF